MSSFLSIWKCLGIMYLKGDVSLFEFGQYPFTIMKRKLSQFSPLPKVSK